MLKEAHFHLIQSFAPPLPGQQTCGAAYPGICQSTCSPVECANSALPSADNAAHDANAALGTGPGETVRWVAPWGVPNQIWPQGKQQLGSRQRDQRFGRFLYVGKTRQSGHTGDWLVKWTCSIFTLGSGLQKRTTYHPSR